MHDSWKLEAFEAMGEKLSVAKSAIGRVETASKNEEEAMREGYSKADERYSKTSEKFLKTDELRKQAIKSGDKAKVRDLDIQFRAEMDLVKRFEDEKKAYRAQEEQAKGRAEKLKKELGELGTQEEIVKDWERKIANKEDEQQGNILVKNKGLAEAIESDKQSLASAKAKQQELWDSVNNMIKASDAKQVVAGEKKADEEARKTWPGGQKEKYEKLGGDIDKKKDEALTQDALSKALGDSLKLYEAIDAAKAALAKATVDFDRLSRAKEAAELEVKNIGIFTSKENDEKAKKALEEVMKQWNEADKRKSDASQNLYFANAKVAEEKNVLPREELLKRKENADVAKATLDMEGAKLGLEKGEIAVAESKRQREETETKFNDKLGKELVGKVAETAKKRDEAFAQVREAQNVIDLLKSAAFGPDNPVEAKELAEKSRDAAKVGLDNVGKDLAQAKLDLSKAPEKDQAALKLYIEALEEDLAARQEQFDVADAAAKQREAACKKLEATGALDMKIKKVEAEKALKQTNDDLIQLQKQTALLDPVKDKTKIAENEKTINRLKDNATILVETIGKRQKELETRTAKAVETEKKGLDEALEGATKADKEAEAAEGEKKQKIDRDPELKKIQGDLEKKIEDELRAMSEKIMGETFVDAAAKDLAIAQFQKKIGQSKEKHQQAFAKFGGLTDQSFDEIYEKQEGSFENAIQKLATVPDPKDDKKRIPNPDYEKEYNTAKEAFVELIEQDQILEDLGASFEDRLRAFQGVPKALWPPKFREEVKAYREVSLLIEEEKVQEEAVQKEKEKVKEGLIKTLGEAYEQIAPALDLIFAVWDSADSIKGIGQEETSPETVKEKLAMLQSIGSALASFVSSNKDSITELTDEEDGDDEEGAKGEKGKPGEKGKGEGGSVKKKGEHDETLKILEFVKSTLVSQATLTGSVLTAVGKEVPGIDVALGAIETAEAVFAAGKSIKMAYNEHGIQDDVDSENDEIMKKAMSNQTGRSKEVAVKRSVNATAKGIQLAGSSVTASGVGAAVGVGLKVGGVGLEQGNKFAFQCIDWKAAAKAKATLDKAVAGSYSAMQAVFADHQMYATSYIVLRARDGDMAATKMCVGRGVDQGKLLDEAVSIKMIRKLMLEVVDQQDHMETVGETAASTWDKICKVGKVIKSKFVDEPETPTPPTTPQQPSSTGSSDLIPDPKTMAKYLKEAEEVSARFGLEPTSYTVKDVALRQTLVEGIVPSVRKLLTSKSPQEVTQSAGASPEVVKGQIDRLNMLLFALPKKPLSRDMRPAKKEFSTAEERLRRTR